MVFVDDVVNRNLLRKLYWMQLHLHEVCFFKLFPFNIPIFDYSCLKTFKNTIEKFLEKKRWRRCMYMQLRVILPPRIYRILSSDEELPFLLRDAIQSSLETCRRLNLENGPIFKYFWLVERWPENIFWSEILKKAI